MRKIELIMDMPVIIDIPVGAPEQVFKKVFAYFHWVDKTFSPFKKTSEVTKYNKGSIKISKDLQEILALCEKTKRETDGYFDIFQGNQMDPSGLVKGWAIHNAAKLLSGLGIKKYYVEAGGDIEVAGTWTIGIRNPFEKNQIIKRLKLADQGIATSGTYERGNHVYNPKSGKLVTDIVSLTVIGPNAYEADRFATAAFAMGKNGISFIENLEDFEGYMIDTNQIATLTRGFYTYEIH